MSSSDTYFQDMSAHALLNIATKGSFRGEKFENLAFLGYFSEDKRSSTTKVNNVFFIILNVYTLMGYIIFAFFTYILVATGGWQPLYSSACYLIWFVCFYGLLNSGVFRTLSNIQVVNYFQKKLHLHT